MLKFVVLVSCLTLTISCGQTISKQNSVGSTDLISETTRGYNVVSVVNNLDNPWGMTWLPDGSMLITEKSGTILHFKNGEKTKLKNVPTVYNRGQGGLLDIELHPNYEQNGWIYISYASSEGSEIDGDGGNTKLARVQLKDGALILMEDLYKATPNTTKGQHFGSRIEFDNEGYVYFTIGERGQRDVNPQDITRDGGKVYRLHDDGRIPVDNPFVNDANAKTAIFTYGNRNPQGMAKHPTTGEIWIHEHGPKGGDEINILKSGTNYGWPVISYGVNYSGSSFTEETEKEGMEQPIYYWVPSIAPCGMDFIRGNQYPGWEGRLLVGSLKFNYVELLEFDTNNHLLSRLKIAEDVGRVRNVKLGPDGLIYIAVEGKGIVRLEPK